MPRPYPTIFSFVDWCVENGDLYEEVTQACENSPCEHCGGSGLGECPTCGKEEDCQGCNGNGNAFGLSPHDIMWKLYNLRLERDKDNWERLHRGEGIALKGVWSKDPLAVFVKG